jgi:DNA-binding transcriptional LysR family regulator
MFNDLNDIRLFAEVVRRGAVTRGAAALGMPVATVSRRLSALEREVGARLIERSARRFELTDAGRAYHAAAARVVEDIELASAQVSGLTGKPAGQLRVAAPSDFAIAFMAGPITSFASQYPDISISLDLSPRRVDLLGEGFDLAVRMGELKDSQLVSRKLTTLSRSLYASPRYLAETGQLDKPDALLRCRMVTLEAYGSYANLALQRIDRPATKRAIPVAGHVTVNSMTMLRQLLLAGAGIALVPDRLMAADVLSGNAVKVLAQWQAPPVEAHLLFRSRSLLPQRVRLFIDHLVTHLDERSFI